MKTQIRVVRFATLASVFVAALTASLAGAQTQVSDARSVLKDMSDYVSSQKTIELTFDSDFEAVTAQLEKIQFTNSGEVLLSRPDKLHGGTGRAAIRDVALLSQTEPLPDGARFRTARCSDAGKASPVRAERVFRRRRAVTGPAPRTAGGRVCREADRCRPR